VRGVNGKLRCADDMGLDGGLMFFFVMKYMVVICFSSSLFGFVLLLMLYSYAFPPHCVSHDLRYTLLYDSRSFHAVPTISYLAIVFLLISDFLAFV